MKIKLDDRDRLVLSGPPGGRGAVILLFVVGAALSAGGALFLRIGLTNQVLFATIGGGGYNPLEGVPVEFVLVTFVALAILGGIPLAYRDRRRVHFIHVSTITKLRASCLQVSLHRASSAGRVCLFAGLRKLLGRKRLSSTPSRSALKNDSDCG